MSATFDLQELLDRVWVTVGVDQDEDSKGLYRDELAIIAEDAMIALAMRMCGNYELGRPGNPEHRFLFEDAWLFPIVSPGHVLYLDDSTKTTPSGGAQTRNILPGTIHQVYYRNSDLTVRTRCTRARNSDELERPTLKGLIYYGTRDGKIELVDTLGNGVYSSTACNLIGGYLEVHACFVPKITDFPNRATLQTALIEEMVTIARAKMDARLAAALEKEKAA